MNIVIAPDSFKHSAPAREVADAIAEGWREVRPDDSLTLIPQADGGEGTLDAIEAAIAGAIRRQAGTVTGPDGRPVPGEWLELPGGVAVVELAQMSGLPMMEDLDSLGATTRGLGEVIRAALFAGARSLVVGLGGSASTDGGAGALEALGLELRTATGAPLGPGGGGLLELGSVDRARLLPVPPGGITLLTDVAAPLLGPTGAAAVFGPQKGATPADVASLDAALGGFAARLGGDPAVPGTGAAGGTAYGFAAAWGARIEPGADYLSKLSGVPAALANADVLISGEGRFDDTSLGGKIVGQLISAARERGLRIGVIAGQVATSGGDGPGGAIWTASLVDIAGSVDGAMADPIGALREAGRLAARQFG